MLEFGAWNVNPILCPEGKLPEKIAAGYAEAFKGWEGVYYEPRIYCGTQLVEGTNHMFICVGTLPNVKEIKLAKVVLSESLKEEGKTTGKFSVLSVDEFDRGGEDGGWVFNPSLCEGGSLPQHLATALPELLKSIIGCELKPLLFCGTQQVNGMNYMLIFEATLVTPGQEKHIENVVLHEKSVEGQIVGEFSILNRTVII